MTPVEIAGAASASIEVGKTAIEIAKGLLTFSKSFEFRSAMSDLLGKLADEAVQRATEANERRKLIEEVAAAKRTEMQLREEIRRLKEELADAKERKSDFERYQLVRVSGEMSLHALKGSAAEGEPPHWLCPRCRAQGVKSALRVEETHVSGREGTGVRCPVCGFGDFLGGRCRPAFV